MVNQFAVKRSDRSAHLLDTPSRNRSAQIERNEIMQIFHWKV